MNRLLTYLTCFLILNCQTKLDKKDLEKAEVLQVENRLDTLLNTNDYLIIGEKQTKVKVVKKNEVNNFLTFKTMGEYKDDIIIGENGEYDSLQIYKKYNPKTSFKDYQVDVYQGKLVNPNFSTNPNSKKFSTRIKNECLNGINFAGYYTLVTWGCGSPCQSGVVVNRKTGKIYDGYGTSLGSEFKKDSKMIITNIGAIDTATNLIEICGFCEVSHEIWTGVKFKEIE